MNNKPSKRSSQRGAVIIQVAVALLALCAFSAFVLDYGIMWTARGQVQTAADAGALAAAISLAFEDGTDFDAAKVKAQTMAKRNVVWGEEPDVLLTDITFPPCPPGAPGVPDTCVKVDAFRNQLRDNPLPIFFGNLIGISDQGVRATATAQVATASITDCLRPWAVVDRWDEFGAGAEPEYEADDDWQPNSTYDTYSDGQGQSPPQENDLYLPPGVDEDHPDGTGFTTADSGRRFAVKSDSNENSTVSSGWFRAIRIPRTDGQNGGSVYRDNIEGCGGLPTSWAEPGVTEDCPDDIGQDDMAYWATQGCYAVEPGNMVGPTGQGVDTLIGDNTDVWVGDIGGHMEDAAGNVIEESPRLVPIGVIDIDNFLSQDPGGANGVLRIVNIYGFFIEGMGDVDDATGEITCCSNGGKAVVGRLVKIIGTGASLRTTTSTFLRSVMLVR